MTEKSTLPSWLPYVAGTLLVIQFAGLAAWQVSRGLDKAASREAFSAQSGFVTYVDEMEVRPYQRLRADGTYLEDKQVVLDNIIFNSRYGHYVLTALDRGADQPVLIVNRGWTERQADGVSDASLAVSGDPVRVHGHVGALPKAGMRMGAPFEGSNSWPMHAVYPELDEVSEVLGRPVLPFVLLLDPEEPNGLVRHWVPEEMGPSRHFGYALQWFAMAAVLSGLLVWNYRRRRARQ